MHRGRNVFGDYYLQKYNGRKLTWHSSMESCTLKAHFEQGVKDLQVWVHAPPFPGLFALFSETFLTQPNRQVEGETPKIAIQYQTQDIHIIGMARQHHHRGGLPWSTLSVVNEL